MEKTEIICENEKEYNNLLEEVVLTWPLDHSYKNSYHGGSQRVNLILQYSRRPKNAIKCLQKNLIFKKVSHKFVPDGRTDVKLDYKLIFDSFEGTEDRGVNNYFFNETVIGKIKISTGDITWTNQKKVFQDLRRYFQNARAFGYGVSSFYLGRNCEYWRDSGKNDLMVKYGKECFMPENKCLQSSKNSLQLFYYYEYKDEMFDWFNSLRERGNGRN